MDEIIFKTTQHCIDYVKQIKTQDDILSSIDRKTLFKARQYFVANFNSFSSENIFFLLNNEYFKSFTNLQAEDLLKACNLKETSLPVFLNNGLIVSLIF